MSTSTAGARRPASTRGGRGNKHKLAEDLGRRGEEAPSWLGDDPSYAEAYERGVSARDRAAAGAPPKPRKPEPSSTSPATEATRPGDDSPSSSTRDARPEPSRSSASGLSFRPSRSIETVGDSLGSVILGLLGYAVVMNGIRSGWVGVKQWMSAKFTNGDGKLP